MRAPKSGCTTRPIRRSPLPATGRRTDCQSSFDGFRPAPPGGLWLLSLSGRRQARPVPQTETRGANGRFSPDGRWFASTSQSSPAALKCTCSRFRATGAKWLISRNGGVRPRWRRDGKELFYITAERRLAAVPIVAGETLQAGDPSELFDVSFSPTGVNPYPYAVSADGQRFLVITPEETTSSAAIPRGSELDGRAARTEAHRLNRQTRTGQSLLGPHRVLGPRIVCSARFARPTDCCGCTCRNARSSSSFRITRS